jgi:hypothetical protein
MAITWISWGAAAPGDINIAPLGLGGSGLSYFWASIKVQFVPFLSIVALATCLNEYKQ